MLITLLCCQIAPSKGAIGLDQVEVTFEEVGEMAASVAYAHLHIPVDLRSYKDRLEKAFEESLLTRTSLMEAWDKIDPVVVKHRAKCEAALKQEDPAPCKKVTEDQTFHERSSCGCRSVNGQVLYERMSHYITLIKHRRDLLIDLLGLEPTANDDFDDFEAKRARPKIKSSNFGNDGDDTYGPSTTGYGPGKGGSDEQMSRDDPGATRTRMTDKEFHDRLERWMRNRSSSTEMPSMDEEDEDSNRQSYPPLSNRELMEMMMAADRPSVSSTTTTTTTEPQEAADPSSSPDSAAPEDMPNLMAEDNMGTNLSPGASGPAGGTLANEQDQLKQLRQSINGGRRRKRFVGLVAGLGVLTGALGTFMGLFDYSQIAALQNQVEQLESQTNAIIHSMNENRLQINQNALHIAQLSNLTRSLAEEAVNYRGYIHIMMHGDAYFVTVLDYCISMEDEIRDILDGAARHRIPITLLTGDGLDQAFLALKDKAEAHQYQLLIAHPVGLLQTETSFTCKDHVLHFFAHMPISRPATNLHLYRYAPMPLDVIDQHLVLAKPREDLIAIGGDHTDHRVLTTSELTRCNHYNRFYICPQKSILSSRMNDTCIGALWTQDREGVLAHCHLEVTPARDMAHQIDGSTFLLFAAHHKNTNLQCDNGTVPKFIENYETLTVPAGCVLRTNDLVLTGDIDLAATSTVHTFTWMTQPRPFLEEAERGFFQDQLRELRELGKTPTSLQQLKYFSLARSLSTFHMPMIIGLGVGLTVLLMAILLLYRCFFKATRPRRRNRNDNNPPGQELNLHINAQDPILRHPPPPPRENEPFIQHWNVQ